MGIVGMQRIFCVDGKVAASLRSVGQGTQFPSIIGFPGRILSLLVRRIIFEVTVLDQFCIETTVSRIVDVLKEDTHQIRTDRLGFSRTDAQRSFERLQVGKAYRILFAPFAEQRLSLTVPLGITVQILHHGEGSRQDLSLHRLTGYGKGFCRSHVIPQREAGSLFRGRVVTLRCPMNQVGRGGMCQDSLPVVHLPPAVPQPFVVLQQLRMEHPFLRTPVAIIAIQINHAVTYRLPMRPVTAPGQLQATPIRLVRSRPGP